jgi:hypothetical protein
MQEASEDDFPDNPAGSRRGGSTRSRRSLTACGSASTGSPATPTTPAAIPPSAAAAYNATDVAFTGGIIRLEDQARAWSGAHPARSAAPARQDHRAIDMPLTTVRWGAKRPLLST